MRRFQGGWIQFVALAISAIGAGVAAKRQKKAQAAQLAIQQKQADAEINAMKIASMQSAPTLPMSQSFANSPGVPATSQFSAMLPIVLVGGAFLAVFFLMLRK